jgi:endonuclease/exonuclease/phosphatase family metal-dependent hydrolase
MTILKKILKAFLILFILIVVGFAGIIVYAVISDFRPAEKIIIAANESPAVLNGSAEISILTWNIGYCGMDSAMDFFYDGGKKVFTPAENCVKNLSSVMNFLKSNDSVDFIFLQEVDRDSKRSYRFDEYSLIRDHLKNYSSYFATNYNVFFVPVPPSSPMGKVYSGISTLSKVRPDSVIRYSFPGQYGFPKQLFMLDRCFLVNRYPLVNGRELILINTHNEAFDSGEIRRKQMMYLKSFLLNEYEKGNYVIAGGDWNQCPPDFKPGFSANKVNKEQMAISSDYLHPDWKWVYDSSIPTNRTVIEAYDPATTTTTVIDFFLLSPNIESVYVKCLNLRFEFSDHNPVIIKAKLN